MSELDTVGEVIDARHRPSWEMFIAMGVALACCVGILTWAYASVSKVAESVVATHESAMIVANVRRDSMLSDHDKRIAAMEEDKRETNKLLSQINGKIDSAIRGNHR